MNFGIYDDDFAIFDSTSAVLKLKAPGDDNWGQADWQADTCPGGPSRSRHISLVDIEERFRLRDLPTMAWADAIGPAVMDEAQKVPTVFDPVGRLFG